MTSPLKLAKLRSPLVVAVAVLGVGAGLAGAAPHHDAVASSIPTPSTAAVDPADFAHPHANRYFPLRPGTVTRYRGTDEQHHLVERVRVTRQTKVIEGVTTTVVRDVTRNANGSLHERTEDWYALDNDGNAWYFGEATATYEHGQVDSREGSWQAGQHHAKPGIIMPIHPRPTDAYRQELRRGVAEDQAWIVQTRAVLHAPRRTYHHVVRSFEWSRLEPGVVSVKFYARGLGIVREQDLAGGDEVLDLVSVERP